MVRPRGFTLVEVILATALIAGSLLVLVSLLPAGVLSLKKAENVQAATAYGLEVLEYSRAHFSSQPAADLQVTLNNTVFRVHRDVFPVPNHDHLYDVAVSVAWNPQPQPVILSTRLYRMPATP